MDPGPQDGFETAGWTRERRTDPRAQDGLESAGWTRERRMNPRACNGFERRGWTSTQMSQPIRKKNDTTEPPDCSKFPKTWVLSYLTPTSPTRVQPAQSFQKKEQNQKKQIARQTPRSQAPCQIAGSTRERKMDPRAISGHERAGWTPERRMDPGAQDGPKRLMDSRPQDGPDRRIDSRVLAAFQTVSRSISPPFCKETHRIFSMHLISFQVLQQRPARNS
jgi:hypothetical protein